MGSFKIWYALSVKGQKEDLRLGGSGRRYQSVDVPEEEREGFLADPEVMVDVNGNAVLPLIRMVDGRPNAHRLTTEYSVEETRKRFPVNESIHPIECTSYRLGSTTRSVEFDAPCTAKHLLIESAKIRAAETASRAAAEQKRDMMIASVADEIDAARAEAERQSRENTEAKERREREAEEKTRQRKAEVEAEVKARAEWIREHGSERLRMILEEGLIDDSLAVYREERRALERPEWVFDSDWHGGEVEHRDIRNPSEAALGELRLAKSAGIDCWLAWAHYGRGDDEYGYYGDNGEPVESIREPILVSVFLGKRLVKRLGEMDNG